MRTGEKTFALSEFKKLISESSLVVDEAVPLLMRLRTEIDWDQAESSWFASDPLSRVFEGSLADLFHLSARGNWIYAIHPVDLLAALSSDYLVVEKGERVRKISQEQGCTATVCLLALNEQVLYCANAGDSRAIIAKHNGQAVPLSIDHKPSLRNERRRVLFAGGQVKGKQDPRVEGDLNLSRAIGDWRHKQNNSLPLELQMISPRPDITATKLSDEDEYIVLGCDGIWERFSSSDCASLVASSSMKSKKIADVTRSVCEATVRKNDEFPGAPIGVTIGCDNMTLLLVRLDEQIRKNFSAPVSYPLTMPIVSYGEQVPEEWNPHTVHPAADKRKKKHGKRGHKE
jgi:serine/threonine protein phosphatase PrpC